MTNNNFMTRKINDYRQYNLLLAELVLKLCDCLFSGSSLLQEKGLVLWTKLDISCLLQEKISSDAIFLNLGEDLLQRDKHTINKKRWSIYNSKFEGSYFSYDRNKKKKACLNPVRT